jgi:predicted dehydrogenase
MVRKAEAEGLTLMVSQNYRFRTWIRSARRFLESEELGRVSHAYVSFRLNPDWGPFRQKMDDVLLIEMSIHHFDMMRYLLGKDPTEVFARTWNPPWSWFRGDCAAAVNLDMEGMPVLYEGSSVAFGKHTGWNGEWRIECEKGSLEYDECSGLRYTHFKGGGKPVELLKMPVENQEYSLVEFESSLGRGVEPETNGVDNLKSLAMVFAALGSKSMGEPVRVVDLLNPELG